ncbi:MAG: restriction endonuclease subunit S, partial [Nitrospirae bacterium]|nr:restriction endonuclease subunit S [Nitrospirota bacterium]
MSEEQIPNGFKMTEIGVLPADWAVESLRNTAKISSGGSAPQGGEYFNGKNPFIRVQHIEPDSDRITKWDLITNEAVKKYKLKLFPKETIVFPKSGASIYLEKRAKLPVDAFIVSHLCAVLSDNQKALQNFLFYALKYIKFSKEKADGYPTLNLSEIKKVRVPLPPLPEQQKIISVFSTIQEAKEKTDNVIKALKELKKSMMKHLFTYG